MSSGYDWEEEFDDGDGEREESDFGGKNVVLFLVDGGVEMHEKAGEEEWGLTLFQQAITAAVNTYKSKILTSQNDVLSVVCFRTTNKVPETSDFDNISVLCRPGPPSAENILKLEALLMDDGTAKFETEYGWQGGVKLHEVLWQCQSLMSGVKGKIGSRRVLLLTCMHDPHQGDQTLNLQARRKAGDLHANNILLDVIPVTKQEGTFNTDIFYSDIIKLADDEWQGGHQTLDTLSDTVLKKTFVKRTTARLKFDINGLEVGVSVYNMLGRPKRPTKQKLARDTSELVKSERTWIHPVDETPLLPSDMAKFMNYGGRNIKMSDSEVKHIQGFGQGDNFLRLLGFRDKKTLKLGNHVRLPQFIYPCENLVKGSSNFLNALLNRCAARDKVAICSFKARSISGPSYVALLPQLELIEDGAQVKPPGFHLVYLPFLDDHRNIPERRLNSNNPREAVEAAKSVISKLKLKSFIPVENASLQTVYRMVEAHALQKETMDKVEDETLPDLDRMKRKLGDRSDTFIKQVYQEDYDPYAKPKKAKPAASKEDKPSADKIDMKLAVQNGSIKKLTVDVLKTWLKSKGCTVSNKKKADLIAEITCMF